MKMWKKVLIGAVIVAGSAVISGGASQKGASAFQKAKEPKTEQGFGAAGNTHSINWQSQNGDTLYNLKIKSTALRTPWRVLSWAKRVMGVDSLLNTAKLTSKLKWAYETSQSTSYFDHEKVALLYQPEESMAKKDANIQIVNMGVMTNMDSTWVFGANSKGAVWLSPNGLLVCVPYGQTRPVLVNVEIDKSGYYEISDTAGVFSLEKNGVAVLSVRLTRATPEEMTLDNLKVTDPLSRKTNEDNSIGTQSQTQRLTIEGHNNVDMTYMMGKYGLKDGNYSYDSTIVFPYSADYPLYGPQGVDARAGFTVTDKGAAIITFPAVGNEAYISSIYLGQILNKQTASGNLAILPKEATACDYFASFTSIENDTVAFSVTSVAEGGTVTVLGLMGAKGLANNTDITWKASGTGMKTELTCSLVEGKGGSTRNVSIATVAVGPRSPIVEAASVEAQPDRK